MSSNQASVPIQCSIAGDDNIYGVGLRASLYLQWVGIIIAYHHTPGAPNNNRVVSYTIALCVRLLTEDMGSTDHRNQYIPDLNTDYPSVENGYLFRQQSTL